MLSPLPNEIIRVCVQTMRQNVVIANQHVAKSATIDIDSHTVDCNTC